MIHVGNKRECFFDNYLIDEEKTTAEQRLHKPVRKGVVLEMDKPWEGETHFHCPIFVDGKWRMYYNGRHNDLNERCICFVESEDGIHWTRPDLGIVQFRGSKHNNIILNKELLAEFDFNGYDNFGIFYDENPACKEDEKFKMVAWWCGHAALTCLKSADGIHFTKCDFVTDDGEFDSQNRAFWSAAHGKYFCYYRGEHVPGADIGLIDRSYMQKDADALYDPETYAMRDPGDGTFSFMRDVRVIESEDFEKWSAQKPICYNGKDFQIYNNCVFPYPRAPHILVGFPLRYAERKSWTKNYDELCDAEERKGRMARMARLGLAVTDAMFMSSRDGVNFTKFDEAIIPPPPETPGAFVYGDGAVATALLEVPSDIPGAENEYMLIVRENFRCVKGPNRLVKYTSRLDGFVSRYAGGDPAKVVTKEFTYTGKDLYANIATSARGYAYFTLKSEEGDFTSIEVFGNSTDKRIRFEDDETVKRLSGKKVILEIEMFDCDIYAIRFA